MSAEGKILWQIKTDSDQMGLPFMYFFSKEEPILIDRWDSGRYQVDMKTGLAEVVASFR